MPALTIKHTNCASYLLIVVLVGLDGCINPQQVEQTQNKMNEQLNELKYQVNALYGRMDSIDAQLAPMKQKLDKVCFVSQPGGDIITPC